MALFSNHLSDLKTLQDGKYVLDAIASYANAFPKLNEHKLDTILLNKIETCLEKLKGSRKEKSRKLFRKIFTAKYSSWYKASDALITNRSLTFFEAKSSKGTNYVMDILDSMAVQKKPKGAFLVVHKHAVDRYWMRYYKDVPLSKLAPMFIWKVYSSGVFRAGAIALDEGLALAKGYEFEGDLSVVLINTFITKDMMKSDQQKLWTKLRSRN